ncbi:conserved hypothetical protein [Alteromonas sp. 38]|uniref:hypothetical protein n=1 Tax=Alteromonas TaxID=226 RepID=UPI0012F373B3|nr:MULTISPECIES: hypothetical protein [Alteromonas]CAD5275213.1 conserved hypothetical protein [Alteromonas sp. 154]VXB64242.1 conserved hypothetical protein [Alteromonas sp. 38]
MSDILESVLSSILIDMINAQNQANIRSADIAESYVGLNRKHELLQYFDVPTANIKSFDFELKFALEQTDAVIGEGMSKALSDLIHSELQAFIQSSLQHHQLPNEDADALKAFISSIWKRDKTVPPTSLKFQSNKKLIDDIQQFIKSLKQLVHDFGESKPLIEENESNSGLKALLTINDLNSYNNDILCSINVKAEVVGMKAGYADKKGAEGADENLKRKIFLAGT